MAELFNFAQLHPEFSASDALAQLCATYTAEAQRQHLQTQQSLQAPQFNPAMQQHHLQQPPNAQFQAPAHFLSPAQAAHLNLPGTNATASPATLSNHNTPAMQNLALQQQQQHTMGGLPPGSAAMVHQVSHQGTNPSASGTPAAGSANASPNVAITGKRRRASGVNIGVEDSIDGAGVNGTVPTGGGGGQLGAVGKVKQSPRVGGKRQKGNG